MTPQYLLAPAASVFGKDGDIKYKYMYTYTQFPPSTVLPAHNSAPQQKQPCFTNTTRTWHCPGKEAKKHLQMLKKKNISHKIYTELASYYKWFFSGVYEAGQQLWVNSVSQLNTALTQSHGSSSAQRVELLILVKGSNLAVNTSLCPGRQLTATIRKYVFHQLQKLIIKPCQVTGWENNYFTSQD